MSRTRLPHSLALLSAALLTATAPAAMAADTFHLRNLSAQANWTTNPDEATLRFEDTFNNSNLQTGASFQFGSVPQPDPVYGVSGASVGENSPGDLTVDGTAMGRFSFAPANGTAQSPLVVNGQNFLDSNQRLTLRTPSGGLLTAARSNFAINSAWEFATPDAGMRYGMRLSDGGITANGSFDDLVSLDVLRLADGSAGVQLRRVAGDAVGNRTITEAETRSLAGGLAPGHTMAEVNFVVLHMYWDVNNGAFADVELLNVSNGGATIDVVGSIEFNNHYPIFHGETFTRMQVGASWTVPAAPVPEPASLALMLAGLGGVAAVARRRAPR